MRVRRRAEHALSVDPGISGTGFAVWHWDETWEQLVPPVQVGNLYPKYDKEFEDSEWRWLAGALNLSEQLVRVQRSWNCVRVFMEFPSYFKSMGGQTTANSGALVKLSVLVGILAGTLKEVNLVHVNDWKGQLPKVLVKHRIQRRLGESACKQFRAHMWDAVGIGLYMKGHFE